MPRSCPRRRCPASLAAAAVAALAPAASAGVSFAFNFLDPPGTGFNAAGEAGVERREALDRAGGYLSSVLDPAYAASIRLDVHGSATDDDTLASAATFFHEEPPAAPGFTSLGDVARKIRGGDAADPDPSAPDGEIVWNFEDFTWATGSVFAPGEQDLLSTAIHELVHTLGFASDIHENGESGYGDPPGSPGVWTPFDAFVADADGVSIIDSGGVLDEAAWDEASTGGTEAGLTFNGPHAVEANGDELVFLYSPEAWEDGSAVSHLDGSVYTGSGDAPAFLMNEAPRAADRREIRTLSAVELGILRDLGYRLAPELTASVAGVRSVPAPAALTGGGALLSLLVARRRTRSA